MNKEFKKGFVLEVNSWENDGDNCQTHSMHFENIKEARNINQMCSQLFSNSDNDGEGIGNSFGGMKMEMVIFEFLVDNPEVLILNNIEVPSNFREKILKKYDSVSWDKETEILGKYYEKKSKKFRPWINLVMDYNYKIMGSSEYYSRVYDDSRIYEIKEDISFKEVS